MRAFWIRLALPAGLLLAWHGLPGQRPSAAGYVLAANEGETLLRPTSKVIIKADPRTGSPALAMGTQELYPGAGIPLHKHDQSDEVLFLHQGSAVAVLGDRRTPVSAGATVFIPRGAWHGVESTGQAAQLVWIVSPPGLESFFREAGAPPGRPLKQLTPAQMEEIGRKHGTTFRRQ